MNALGVQYCGTCGRDLRAARSASPLPSQPAVAQPVAAVAQGVAQPILAQPAFLANGGAEPPPPPESGRIAPSPVLDIGAKSPPAATIRVCSRCRGSSDATSQFCKFCGASLTEPAIASSLLSPVVASPRPPPPVAAPAPPIAPPIAVPSPIPVVAAPAPPVAPLVSPVVAPVAALVPLVAPAVAHVAPAQVAAAPVAGAPKARGRLVVIAKDGGEGPSYPIVDQLDIGREEGNVIVAEDRYLSPRHARLAWKGGALHLRDLGTMNGIFLRIPANPAPVVSSNGDAQPDPAATEVPLKDQDLILMGQQVIRFEVVRDAEEGFGPALQHGTLLFGTPVAPRYARLCQKTVEGVTRDVFHVRKQDTVLGRESGDIVFTEDPFLSRRHAVIRMDAVKKTFTISDFGSSNGTFLQIRGEVALKEGDEFRVGQQLFRIDLGQAASG